MDFLEANKPAIEEAIYFRIADLLNLDVELIFYDTPSLPQNSASMMTLSTHSPSG
jgi:hypothetical protein